MGDPGEAYAPSYAIKKADVDSFLSESGRREFDYRLLIATTDHLGPTARRTLDASGEAGRDDPALRPRVRWRSSGRAPSTGFAASGEAQAARDHISASAISDVVAGLADRDRGQLVMACGTGKTLAAGSCTTSSAIAADAGAGAVAVAA